jgi:sigma-B regulation protein RsbU (phosphoserine phosphatase)
MTDLKRLLELAGRPGREAAEVLPSGVLRSLVEEAGTSAGMLGAGSRVVAVVGTLGQGGRRYELSAGRDSFWVELDGGAELSEGSRAVAGLVLSSWLVREELKKARFAERRRLWEVESLRAIAEALGGTLEPQRIAEELLLHAAALLDARRGEVWLADHGEGGPVARVSGAASIGPCRDGSCTVAAQIGGGVLAGDEAALLPAEGLLEERRLAVPISGRRGPIGVLALAEREVRGGTAPFGPTDAETLSLFAAQAAVALENAHLYREGVERQRLERELELAASIQRQLLPRIFPAIPGAEVAGRSEPSRHVGGDIYDVVPCSDAAMLMLADLSGKGVPAALMAFSMHAAVHILAQGGSPVAELAQRLHEHLLTATPYNKFATVFLARLLPDGVLEYVSAGHNPALVVGPGGRTELLHATGTPLGLLPEARYESRRITLPPESLLVAYTDGFTEAPAPDGDDDFGLERLTDVILAHRHDPLEALLDALFAAVADHTAGAPAHDDRTVLAVRRLAA